MKKPLLLNVISIVLMIAGIFCAGIALLALVKLTPEQLAQSYGTKNYIVHIGYSLVLGILLFVSGFFLFRGKELGRKVFVGSVLLMAVYAVATQGIWGIQVLGIPVLIVIFLYQYWVIKDYFAKSNEYETISEVKSEKKTGKKKNK